MRSWGGIRWRLSASGFGNGIGTGTRVSLANKSLSTATGSRSSEWQVKGFAAAKIFMSVLFGITVVILIVVCANVGGLFLGRALARKRDVAIRLALGSSRLRLVRQTLVEAFIVAAVGLIVGLFVATYGSSLLL